MDPKAHFKKLVRPFAIRLMNEKGISWEQAVKLIWNDLVLISQFVEANYPDLTEEQKGYEIGGRFDAFLRGEYDPSNG